MEAPLGRTIYRGVSAEACSNVLAKASLCYATIGLLPEVSPWRVCCGSGSSERRVPHQFCISTMVLRDEPLPPGLGIYVTFHVSILVILLVPVAVAVLLLIALTVVMVDIAILAVLFPFSPIMAATFQAQGDVHWILLVGDVA